MKEAEALTRNQVIAVLTKSPHGKLDEYVPIGLRASQEDPDFFGHLIAWNLKKGQIRDSKAALPVLALENQACGPVLQENAAAALSMLPPRELLKAVRFSKGRPTVPHRFIRDVVEQRLQGIEKSKAFDAIAMQHRAALRELYALMHIKPLTDRTNVVLFGRNLAKVKQPFPGVFGDIARLGTMDPLEAAGTIITKRIPFLVAQGAMGARMKEPAVVQALLKRMTATEAVTNTKMLERLGVKTNPVLRAAFEEALARVAKSEKATLKTTVAAKVVGGDLGEKLSGAQEKQLDKLSVKGDWLVIADRSGSMNAAIAVAREISALLARVAAGAVHLVFFNSDVTYFNVTGKTLEEITRITSGMTASGGTHMGAAMDYILQKGILVDGIAVVSDGGENGIPTFDTVFQKYCTKVLDSEVPVYLYQLRGDPPVMIANCKRSGVPLSVFDLTGGVDHYSLPNLVQTMRANRYSLSDEIMETPLLKRRQDSNKILEEDLKEVAYEDAE